MDETKGTATTVETSTEEKTTTNTGTETKDSKTGSGAVKTEEQIRAEVEAELKANYEKLADQRVTAAQKKWKQDQEKKAALEKMSEDEKRKAEDEERAAENARKEHELTIKGLRLDVVDAVAELGLDTGFRNLVAVEDLALISDEEERKKKLTERIKGMKELFDAEVKKQVAKEKAEFLKGHTPPASKEKPTLRELFWELRKQFTFLYFQRRLRITQRLISILQTRGSTISVVIRLLHLSLLQTCLHGLRANVKPERFTL